MCCGSGPKPIQPRSITAGRTISKVVPQSRHTVKVANISRQHIIRNKKCTVCGFPVMSVYVANRERSQCSNPNCRALL